MGRRRGYPVPHRLDRVLLCGGGGGILNARDIPFVGTFHLLSGVGREVQAVQGTLYQKDTRPRGCRRRHRHTAGLRRVTESA